MRSELLTIHAELRGLLAIAPIGAWNARLEGNLPPIVNHCAGLEPLLLLSVTAAFQRRQVTTLKKTR